MKRLPRPESYSVNHVTFSQVYRHMWEYLKWKIYVMIFFGEYIADDSLHFFLKLRNSVKTTSTDISMAIYKLTALEQKSVSVSPSITFSAA